jgi:hypothetical protein
MTVFQHTVPACPSCRQPAGGVHEQDCGAVKVTLRQRIETLLDVYPTAYRETMSCCYTAAEHKAHVVNELMAALQPDIDAIAEAICNAYTSDSESVARWKFQGPFGRNRHRRAARAAVNAWMGQHD